MSFRIPFAAAAVTAAVGALAASPAVAATGSAVVYVNDSEGDIWQVQPDGGNAHAVTTDGTKAAPYARPRLAPDGTVWALKGRAVVHLSATGQPLTTFTPAPLKDSEGNDADRDPEAFDLSPDGTKLSYGVKQIRCSDGGDCNMDSITGIFDTTGKLLGRDTRFLDGTWQSDGRLVGNDGGAYGEVRLLDVATPSAIWFMDADQGIPGWSREPAVSPDGTQLAVLRTVSGVGQFFLTFKIPGTFGKPQPMCLAEKAIGTGTSPAWSPDGKHVVVAAMADGIMALDLTAVNEDSQCATGSKQWKVAPAGSSQPDWGTIPVPDPPQPPVTTTTTTATTTTTTTVPTVPTVPTTPTTPAEPVKPAKAALVLRAQKLKAIRKSGVKVRLTGALPGKLQIVVKAKGKVVGKATVTVPKSGTLDATVRLSKAGARALARLKTASLTISAGGLRRTLKV